jgi:hypothetical protein
MNCGGMDGSFDNDAIGRDGDMKSHVENRLGFLQRGNVHITNPPFK